MIDDLVEDLNGVIADAVSDPDGFEIRRNDPEKVIVEPEPRKMTAAVFDVANNAAKVTYEEQSPRENYVCFKEDPEADTALIQSKAVHDYDGERKVSTVNYILDEGKLYRYDGKDLIEVSAQRRPVEVAGEFEDLYSKALENSEEEPLFEEENNSYSGPDPVPPPEEDEMFPE